MEKFFSICIPQYNRWPYLLESLKVLKEQTFQDFEVCISDDCSTEQGKEEIIQYLESNSISYRFHQQNVNTGYDKNLRASIDLAGGKYVFLLGNDDCLASNSTLETIHDLVIEKMPAVISTKEISWNHKITQGKILTFDHGLGKSVAATTFNKFSFISGIILNRNLTQKFASSEWDGSKNYHIFLASKIISQRYNYLETNLVAIRYDIKIDGKDAKFHKGKYITKHHTWPETTRFGQRMVNNIFPADNPRTKQDLKSIGKIFLHLYAFSFPYHLHHFKKELGILYALKMWGEFRPSKVIDNTKLIPKHRLLIFVFRFISILSLLTNDLIWRKANFFKSIIKKLLGYKIQNG